jgi:hypothetical protein
LGLKIKYNTKSSELFIKKSLPIVMQLPTEELVFLKFTAGKSLIIVDKYVGLKLVDNELEKIGDVDFGLVSFQIEIIEFSLFGLSKAFSLVASSHKDKSLILMILDDLERFLAVLKEVSEINSIDCEIPANKMPIIIKVIDISIKLKALFFILL